MTSTNGSTPEARPGAKAASGSPRSGGGGFGAFQGFEEVDIEDLLGGMFGGRGRGGPIPGADQEAELELDR